MKKKILLLAYVVLSLYVHAQTTIGNQKVDRFPVTVWNDSTYGLTWLPASYASNPGKTYPLIIFLHGTGGAGSGVSGLNNLIIEGLPQQIANGFQPSAVNPKNGQTYEFIVVSPQSASWSYNYNHLKYILPNVLSKYRVDTSRIYLTGLSAGGDGVFTCVASGDSAFIKKIAAAATSSSAGADGVNGLTQAQVEGQLRYATKKYGVQIWNVVGYLEALKDLNVRYHDSLNIDNPVPRDKLTILDGLGHSTWEKQYDSAFRPIKNVYANNLACNNGCPTQVAPNNNGSPVRGTGATQDSLNVYEWFLLWSRTASPPAGTPYAPPAVSVGGDQTITLPNSSANLTSSYTLSGANLTSISWTKFKSPGQPVQRLGILGSSTSVGGGATTFDSSYVGRLTSFYAGAGIVDSVINLAQYGYNPYQAMPTGYTPPTAVHNKLTPSDTPDPAHNITALLSHHPTHVLINFPTNGFDVLTMPEIMVPFQKFADTLNSLGITWYITTTQPRSDAAFSSQAKQQFLQVVRDSLFNRFGSHVINFYDNMTIPGTTQKIAGYDAGDGIHFNNLGHLQLFRQVVGANMFQNAASSPSAITTPASQNTSVTGLTQGIHKFQVTVLDDHKQKNSAVVTVSVNPASTGGAYPPCGSRHRYEIVPNGDTAFWCYRGGNPDVTTFQPGDTLAFAANNTKGNYWTYISLDGFRGNPACPLVMINEGGQTWVKGSTVNISNSSYVKFTGSGAPGIPYGWLMTGKNPALRPQGPFSIVVNNRSKGIEIDSVSIHNTGIGIQIETNGSCADSLNYPNWVLDSMLIHDNRIVGTWNEGMYIGNTSPDNALYAHRPVTCNGQVTYPVPMKNGYTKIWNNYVDSTGRGGIQLANADNGVSEIYNNTVKHNGLNGDDAQGTAISIGLYTHAYIHDNTISNTYTFGIASIGACGTNIPVRIENNQIDSTGYLRTYNLSSTSRQSIDPATEPSFPDTLTWPFPIWVDTRQRVYTTDNPAGTAVHGQDSTQFWIKNNVIGRFICYTSTRDNQSAIQIEDHALGLQSSGNIICNNTSSIGQNIAIYTGKAGHPVAYSTNCGSSSASNTEVGRTSALLLESIASGEGSVKVYPSPVVGNSVFITAQNETSGRVIVSLLDMSGKLVQMGTFNKGDRSFQQQLYLRDLPKGIYLLKIQFNGKTKPDLFKLVKM